MRALNNCYRYRFNFTTGGMLVLRNAMGGIKFPGKSIYEDIRFNAISVTRGWMGVKFPDNKHYVTLERPPIYMEAGTFHLIEFNVQTLKKCYRYRFNFTIAVMRENRRCLSHIKQNLYIERWLREDFCNIHNSSTVVCVVGDSQS